MRKSLESHFAYKREKYMKVLVIPDIHLKTWILLLIHKKDSNTIKPFELYLLSTSFLSQGYLCIKERGYLCLLICNEINEEYAEIWASGVALVAKNPHTNAGNKRCEFDS